MIKPLNSIWTDEQWEAIASSGNTIVSAGAGSGKTAVLTERVIYKLKEGIPLSNMIVLTFTNAAALEMKERIKEKIKSDLDLKEQLDYIDQANITTFDAYSLSLVKKYYYLLGIEKDINIIDKVFLSLNKDKILDEIFEEEYNNEDFRNFIDIFTIKDDIKIKKKIDEFNSKLDNIYDKESYLKNYFLTKMNDINIENYIKKYVSLLKEQLDSLIKLHNNLLDLINDPILVEYFKKTKEMLLSLNKESYDSYLLFKDYFLNSYPRNKGIDEDDNLVAKEYHLKIKECFSKLKELVCYENEKEIKEELFESKKYLEIIIRILIKYNKRIFEFKLKNNSFEFSDILFFSIRLLIENPEILNFIKYNTLEIMVDEFQDTNDNNEYFLSLISNNNLYMVGDVKQSIYRFRNANSKIFTDTYCKYKEGFGTAIDLNRNFRSRKEVVESINLIFKHIMDVSIGGVDYNESQELIFGNKSYQNNEDDKFLEVLNYSYDENKNIYSKDEIEAFIIAEDIINKVKNKYQVFDLKNKCFRNIQYSDIVILQDRKTSFELYKQIFEYKGIPLTLHKEDNFSYSNIIFTMKNLLKLINMFYTNDYSDLKYAFFSVGRSYICQYDDELLFNNLDNILSCLEFEPFISKIKYLANYYENNSLSALLLETYNIFNLYLETVKLKDVKDNNLKLDYLVILATNLEESGYDLNDFIIYFDAMFEKELDVSFNIEKVNNASVSIMTIHKSKGLEFPICYYSSLYKEFNMRDTNDSYLFDNNIGLIVPIFKEGIKDTILKTLAKENYTKEDIEERIRLFYVALTRAKEKIILLSNIEELKQPILINSNGIVDNLTRLDYRSFNDILVSIKKYLKHYIKTSKFLLTKDYEVSKKINYFEKLSKTSREFNYMEINVKKELIVLERYSLKSEDTSSFDFGNLLHEILEYLDFSDYLNDLNNYDLSDNLKEKIKAFFTMPFMENTLKYYKEYSFIDNDSIGVIDLLIETEDKFIVVDYKTKSIDKISYINQIRKYMSYIRKNTNKNVEGYIYSILDMEYIKIDEI